VLIVLFKVTTVDFFLWLGIWLAMNLLNVKHQTSFWKKEEKPVEVKNQKLLGRNRWQFIHSAIAFDHHWIVAQLNNNFKEQWLLGKEISIGMYYLNIVVIMIIVIKTIFLTT